MSDLADDGPDALTQDELAFLRSALDLARTGQTDDLAALVDAGLPVNLTGGQGDSLLMLAAYHDHPDTVEALLARGADTSRVNDRGQTALGAAVFRRSRRSVGALLAAGADPDGGGRTARQIADFFELDEMQCLLGPRRDRAPDAAGPFGGRTSDGRGTDEGRTTA